MSLQESSFKEIFDPIRADWYHASPEERVRGALLQTMIEKLGFPTSLLAVEKELATLPHLLLRPKLKIPKRRADIICFAKEIHPSYTLYPLLLVECKAGKLLPAHFRQITGYNEIVGAPFLTLASPHQILTGFYDAKEKNYLFKEGMPSFTDLLSSINGSL